MWRRRVQGVSQDVSKTSPAIQATAVEAITSELKALNASLLLKQLQRGVILQVTQACRKRWQLGNHTLRMVSDFSLLGPLWFVNISISITFWTSPSTVNDCLDADYPSIYVQIVTLTIVSFQSTAGQSIAEAVAYQTNYQSHVFFTELIVRIK